MKKKQQPLNHLVVTPDEKYAFDNVKDALTKFIEMIEETTIRPIKLQKYIAANREWYTICETVKTYK